MGSKPPPKWASEPCIMGLDIAGRDPVLDSKTLCKAKKEKLFEKLKVDESIGWDVDVIDPRELSDKLLKKNKTNLIEISRDSAIGLINKVLNMGVLLTEVHLDTVGDPEEFKLQLCERFPNIKFVVAAIADSIYPVVTGASIVAKVTRDRALRNWVLDETEEGLHRMFGSGNPGDTKTKAWLEDHKHSVFGFPTLVRFSCSTSKSYSKDFVPVVWESDDDGDGRSRKRQKKLTSSGFRTPKRKIKDVVESSGKGRCRFFQDCKLDPLRQF